MRLFWIIFMLGMAIFFEVTLLNFFPILGVKPDLVLIIIVFNAFLRGSREGALVGLLGGIFEDLAVGSYFGMNALSLMVIGYGVGLTESKLLKESTIITIFLVWMSSFTVQVLNYILLSFAEVYVSPGIALFRIIIPTATYTAVLVPFFYWWFYRSNKIGWLNRREI